MAQIRSGLASSAVAPALLKRAKWSWLGYGAAAYVTLRLMRRYGVMGEYPDRALNFIEGNFLPQSFRSNPKPSAV